MNPYFAYSHHIGTFPRGRFHAGDFYFDKDDELRSIIRGETIESKSFERYNGDIITIKSSLIFEGQYLYFQNKQANKYIRKDLISYREDAIIKWPKEIADKRAKYEKSGDFIFAYSFSAILIYNVKTQQQIIKEISDIRSAQLAILQNKQYIIVKLAKGIDVYDLELQQLASVSMARDRINSVIYICGDIIYCVFAHLGYFDIFAIDIFRNKICLQEQIYGVDIKHIFTHSNKLYAITNNFNVIIVKMTNGRIAHVQTKLCKYPDKAMIISASHYITSAGKLIIAIEAKNGIKPLHFIIADGKTFIIGNGRSFFYDDLIINISCNAARQHSANIYFLDPQKYSFAKLYKYINRGDRKKAIAIAAAIRTILLPQIGQSYKYIAAEVCRYLFRGRQ